MREKKFEAKKGMRLFIVETGNRLHGKSKDYKAKGYEVVVVSVGAKNFVVEYKWDVGKPAREHSATVKFRRSDNMQATDYCQDWRIFSNEQEYLEENEYNILRQRIAKRFEWLNNRKYSLQALRMIEEILSKEEA